jgi:dTDP-4-dehydrorhamnose reductase
MRVAITGAAGRLGAALVTRLSGEPDGTVDLRPWTRSEFDLDAPGDVGRRLATDRPTLVIHAAAWTDVDACARDPELAMRRNGEATTALARACADAGVSLMVMSTNEVFDGDRTDGRGYRPDDPVNPPNAYGRSKLAGEVGAAAAFDGMASSPVSPALGIVRTSWLFGPGKPDFPAKIVAAARSASAEGRSLRLVNDEFGTPTYVPDLADAIARLAGVDFRGIHHIVNAGTASRADWARDVLGRVGVEVPIEEVSLSEFDRPSTPPRWGVLEATALPGGPLRHWREAMTDRLATLEGAG